MRANGDRSGNENISSWKELSTTPWKPGIIRGGRERIARYAKNPEEKELLLQMLGLTDADISAPELPSGERPMPDDVGKRVVTGNLTGRRLA